MSPSGERTFTFVFNERKRFQAGKGKEIPHTNNYGCELRRWHSPSSKYSPKPKPSYIVWNQQHRPPCQRRHRPPCQRRHRPPCQRRHRPPCQPGIGLHVNADKTEYMCFNQRDNISTLKAGPLKLVDKFTYLGSSVSSTEKDINTLLAKAWTANDRLAVIWKSDLTDKIKYRFSKQHSCRYCYMDPLHWR